MKRLLFTLLLLGGVTAQAANPSFDSFVTNDFIKIPPYIYLRHTNSSGTNVFNGNVTIYTNSTINIDNSTNIVNNSYTIYTNSSVTLNGTNLATINPTIGRIPYNADGTNFLDSSLYYIDPNTVGANELRTDLMVFNPAPTQNLHTGIALLNPFEVSFMPLAASTTTPTDTQIRLSTGNGPGALLVIQNYNGDAFELLNGDALWDDPASHVYLSGGDWKPDTIGQAMLLIGTSQGWAEIGRFGGSTNVVTESLWKYSGGYLQPVDLTQPLFWTNSVTWGPGTTNVMANNGPQMTWTSTVTTNSGVTWKMANGNSKFAIVGIDQDQHAVLSASAGQNVRLEPNNGSLSYFLSSSAMWPSSGFPNLGLDGFGWGSFYLTNQIVWGPGTTNVLALTGTELQWDAYMNGSVYPGYRVTNVTDTSVARFVAGGNLAHVYGVSGVNLVDGLTSGNEVRWFTKKWLPLSGGSQLGDATFPWGAYQGYSNVIYGFLSGTNYAAGVIKHTGTNGAVVFESQAAGIAGNPVPFVFTNAPVTVDGRELSSFRSMSSTAYYRTNISLTNLVIGHNDVYTVPSGKRMALGVFRYWASSNNASQLEYKTNGVYAPITASAGASSVAMFPLQTAFLFEEGETFSVNLTNTAPFADAVLILMPNTVPVKTYRTTALSAGDNTIYTVPANTWAQGWAPSVSMPLPSDGVSVSYVNNSGGARTESSYILPPGFTTSTLSRAFITTSFADKASNLGAFTGGMPPGYSYVVNTDANTATQVAWITVAEVPLSNY